MSTTKMVFSPIAATLVGAGMIAAATLGGSLAGERVSVKEDRFELAGDSLCKGQAWPNLTAKCLAWKEHGLSDQPVRFITIQNDATANQTTTLTRVREIVSN